MRIRPVLLSAMLGGGLLLCQPAAFSDASEKAAETTNQVRYRCMTTGAAETQTIVVSVGLTMPAEAVAGQQLVIQWRGSYAGSGLRAPAGGLSGVKVYAYAAISGFPGLTSATGVGQLGTVGAGQEIPLPTAAVELRTTPNSAGTGAVTPAAINIGERPAEPLIECEVTNKTELKPGTLTVAGPGGSPTATLTPTPTSSPTVSPTTSPTPRHTSTVTATVTRSPAPGDSAETPAPAVTRTPAGGADTGGGGDAGWDGRPLVVTGSLIAAAAGAGLLLRRRTGRRRVA
ncbi:hypothetical protein [Sphaerisporangium rubeum]|uniref:Uncharacterized protein n=1 Tax=Sphaerisporangium rubeum TaxID=321317 RepID=A0A7X0IFK8_9ACTN|nr:hypothetical protein [Sphaerisporangium rubeum]MBB6474322.1 hypothetical protein [Sphaerisporangium rubeum]